jgi:hypothetical protein
MSSTLSLTTSSLSWRRPRNLSFNLSRIFRTKAFRFGLELTTILSLFITATVWLMAASSL